MKTKVCRKCGIEKNIEEFPKHKIMKNGYNSWCKLCHNNASKEWRKNNKEKFKELTKEWSKNNRERHSEKKRIWNKNNKEYISKYHIHHRNNLTDTYIIKCIRNNNPSILSKDLKNNPKLIEAWRTNLLIKRAIKELS